MKHILTILFIGLAATVVQSQDFSKILEGEWLVSANDENARYTQTWNFTSDSTLVITRGGSTNENYYYLIFGEYLFLADHPNKLISKMDNGQTDFMMVKFSENSLVAFYKKYPDEDYSDFQKLFFIKKKKVIDQPKKITISDAIFYGNTYKTTSSLKNPLWHNTLMTNYLIGNLWMINDNCDEEYGYYIINTPYQSMITVKNVGTIQIIEAQDSTSFKGVLMDNNLDTITFSLIEENTESIEAITLKEVTSASLEDYLSNQPILSVGMRTLKLFEEGEGKMLQGGIEFDVEWYHMFDDIYIIRIFNSRKDLRIEIDSLILKFEKRDNKVIATELNCKEEKNYFVEK